MVIEGGVTSTMEQLIEEYRITMRAVNKYKRNIKELYPNMSSHKYEQLNSLLGSAISDLQYAIDYMRTGRVPGNRRGIYRQAKDKRTIPVDPNNIDYLRNLSAKQTNAVQFDAEQEQMIAEYLDTLSHQQRAAFKMVKGQGFSYGKTAKIMGISKGTVQDYVKQAEIKLTAIVHSDEDREVFVQRILFSEVV